MIGQLLPYQSGMHPNPIPQQYQLGAPLNKTPPKITALPHHITFCWSGLINTILITKATSRQNLQCAANISSSTHPLLLTFYTIYYLGTVSMTVGGEVFLHPSRPALGPTQAPTQCVPGLSRGWIGQGVALTTPSSVKVKERVELYLYSTSGPWWPVIGWTVPSPFNTVYITYNCKVSYRCHSYCCVTQHFIHNVQVCLLCVCVQSVTWLPACL